MYAPRARFERILIVSPIKVAIIFLTSLHCLFLIIAFLTSFWIETKQGHYGPVFSCEKHFHRTNQIITSMTTECHRTGFRPDIRIFSISLIVLLLVLSFLLSFVSIITAKLSLTRSSFSSRHRFWKCTILLLLFSTIIDSFILVFLPLSYRDQVYHFRWAYGVHCGMTLFIAVSLITSILSSNIDDVRYIEAIDESAVEK
ncbi:unnamed protein product [Adineta ricciae]|uniref:Uncharacterized protein n=1 Tax=Adineta ricciae TaxID=249248 RepID=A0A816FG71_ADIRI|nr:unnamed protein product [Adineta ricciae]CAF1661124.1 unnamed protein product [Adineta ricciae]